MGSSLYCRLGCYRGSYLCTCNDIPVLVSPSYPYSSDLLKLVKKHLIISLFRPIRAQWDVARTYKYHCLPLGFSNISHTIVSTILDFVIVLLPIPMVSRLRIPWRQRIGVGCLFAVGLFICVAGSCRTYYLWYVMYGTWDHNWHSSKIYIATLLETSIAIVCIDRPLASSRSPLLHSWFPSLFASRI